MEFGAYSLVLFKSKGKAFYISNMNLAGIEISYLLRDLDSNAINDMIISFFQV